MHFLGSTFSNTPHLSITVRALIPSITTPNPSPARTTLFQSCGRRTITTRFPGTTLSHPGITVREGYERSASPASTSFHDSHSLSSQTGSSAPWTALCGGIGLPVRHQCQPRTIWAAVRSSDSQLHGPTDGLISVAIREVRSFVSPADVAFLVLVLSSCCV